MASRSSRDVAFKFLVANHQAGYLIGRRGGTIKELQNATGAKIRLSQSADYYPGSKDRVCLIFGSKEQVIAAQGEFFSSSIKRVEINLSECLVL